MARKEDKLDNELEELSTKSHLLVYGSDGTLNKEDKELSSIINQTIIATKDKFGVRTNGKPVNYFNELNFGNVFEDMKDETASEKKKVDSANSSKENFKKFMNSNNQVDPTALLLADQDRLIQFSNYRTIYEHISECAQALDVYKDNIMSPDDFTKMIFDIQYDSSSDEINKSVEEQLRNILTKYKIEEKADEIIGETLKLGEYYVAALSIEDEMNMMLSNQSLSKAYANGGLYNLSESVQTIRKTENIVDVKILTESVNLSEDENNALKSLFSEEVQNNINISEYVANAVNNNIEIGSRSEIMLEKVQAEYDFKHDDVLADIPGATIKKKKETKPKDDKPLYLNGSVIRMLDPARVIDLIVDDVCYGYYYIEESGNTIAGMSYLGTSSGREAKPSVNMGLNNNAPGMTQYTPANSTAQALNTTEEKLNVITDIFLNQISKKIDKPFIRKNKKFKDFLYQLIKQDYIVKKGIKMTYFEPAEVVKFQVPAIYRKITFAAKLYLSMMTNDILVKLGRAHDKRVFYINIGLDANYEQAINKTIDDIKRREYKMDNLNDFNSILNLNPGRWDDYFIPTINGDRPLEMETLAGMDTDLNSEFLQYLKNSMMAGIGVPTNLIDNLNDVNFARTLSAQNSNFVRSVIKYQKLFTEPFSKLIRRLYANEYKYSNDKETNLEKMIDINEIKIHFPSPASLNMTNISEQVQSVEQNADFIASQIIPPVENGKDEDSRIKLKAEIVKDLMPGIDWTKYQEMADNLKLDNAKKIIENPPQIIPGEDPYTMN